MYILSQTYIGHTRVLQTGSQASQEETIATVKRNLNDKLQASNSKIHSTHKCVNVVTHNDFTTRCATEAEF